MELTQCLFLPDGAAGLEYRVDRHSGPNGQTRDTVSIAPYGTELLAFLALDPSALHSIVQAGHHLFPVTSMEDFASKRGQLRWALEQSAVFIRRLPDVLRLYRTRSLQLIARCSSPEQGNSALLRAAMNDTLSAIYTDAIEIIRLHEQMKALLKTDLFAANSEQTPAQRTERLFEALGEAGSQLFAYSPLTTEPYILEMTGGAALCLPTQLNTDLRALAIVMLNDLVQGAQRIVRCGYCNEPFVPQGKALYCDRVQDAEGNTCKQLGAMARYRQTLSQSPAKRAYRQAYKRQFARMRAGKLDESGFEAWKKEAKQRLSALEQDESQLDGYLSWLNQKPL